MKPIKTYSQPRFSSRLWKVLRRLLAFLFGIAGIALILIVGGPLLKCGSLSVACIKAYFWVLLGPFTRTLPDLMPDLSLNMSLGLLFVVGFLTGFHCVGMCGALVLSYATKSAVTGKLRYSGHLLYGLGKTISYTVIGAGFGLMGAIISFTPQVRGMVGIVAGVFLLLFGLSMLNVWPSLRNFRIKTPPALLRFIGVQSRKYGNPFVIGLLNGLMVICGPLQAMYVMAAGTGSALEGAKLMLVFGVGTLPVMLGFGLLTSLSSAQLAPKIIRFSGVIVVALGAIMLNRGLVLSGATYDFTTGLAWVSAQLRDQTGIDMSTLHLGYQAIDTSFNEGDKNPATIVLQKGVPVRWKIHNDQPKACVTGVVVPKLGLDVPLKKGEQIIEFTPQQEGIIPWSCTMGMTTGSFLVVDKDKKQAEVKENTEK